MSRKETVIYGLRAALALAENRPKAIRRVLYTKAVRKAVGALLKATANQKKPYREVEVEDLNRVAGTPHHEGVAIVSSPLLTHPFGTRKDALANAQCLVAIDRITNPHNLGAILRSMAWFGADALLTNDDASALNAAAIRVSQGGAELVPVIRCHDLAKALKILREGQMDIIAADQRARDGISDGLRTTRTCVVLGNENQGISSEVLKACNRRIRIHGPGRVESLNVGVAGGIMLAATAPIDPQP